MSTGGGEAPEGESFPSTTTWSDLMSPGNEDLGWLQMAAAPRPGRPAVGEPESKRGEGRSTSPKGLIRSNKTKPIFPPVQNTPWSGWRQSDVHIFA